MWLDFLPSHGASIGGDLAAQTIAPGLVPCCADKGYPAFSLRFREAWSDFLEDGKMFIDVGFGVLHGNGPLLIPPIRHGKNPAVDHPEPELAPEVHVDFRPVAIVANLLGIEHQRAIYSCTGDVALNSGFLDNRAIALSQFLAELAYVRIIFAGQNFAESGQAGSHGKAIGIVGSTVEHFVLND